MAKRKAPRARGRKKTTKGSARKKSLKLRKRKASAKRPGASKVARKGAKKSARKAARKAVRRVARKPTARKATARQKPVAKAARLRKASARQAPKRVQARKAPALDRERRIVRDEDLVPTPPSSLDLDRTASAARSGRRELHERVIRHNETSPAITAGDVDADWESAYSVGDEAPGGDNPTPDQDIVDEIGRALGVEYADNEELKGEKKISDRDKKRWELDPGSKEDFDDR